MREDRRVLGFGVVGVVTACFWALGRLAHFVVLGPVVAKFSAV